MNEAPWLPADAAAGRSEAEWRQALADKDERFRNLHHRVKNSLQMISSLLVIETRSLASSEAAQCLEKAQQRIQTFIRVHERLYEANEGDADEIDASAQLAALCHELERSTGAVERGLAIVVDAKPCGLTFDKLTPLALIVSELVMNAVRHAAPLSTAGSPTQVKVTFERDPVEGWARLTVADNGPGLPYEFDTIRSAGLSMRLVASFARQLGGTLSFQPSGSDDGAARGASFAVCFPLGR